jgi:hypothetical protein
VGGPCFSIKRPVLYVQSNTMETLSSCSLLGFCKNSDHVCNPSNLSKPSKSRSTSITTMPGDYMGSIPMGFLFSMIKRLWWTHGGFMEHRKQHVLACTTCQPKCERTPICVKFEIGIEGVRMNHCQVSRFVFRRRGRRDTLSPSAFRSFLWRWG